MNQKKRESLSFGDILKLLYTKQKTGLLRIQTAQGEILAHFKEGKIVNVELAKGEEWIIGQYLTESKLLSERKLMKSLKIASREGMSPEEVLVRKGYVSADVLKRYMDLYTREVLLPLFTRVGIVCSFQGGEVQENRFLPPISVPFLLKEGAKRAKEWPLLTKRIPSPEVIYAKDKSFVSKVVREGNPLFSESLDPELGANERIVYFFVDGKRNVKQLSRVAGLDLFSTYKALYVLESKFMAKIVSVTGEVKEKGSAITPYLVKIAGLVVLLAILAYIYWSKPGTIRYLASGKLAGMEYISKVYDKLRLVRVDAAIDQYFAYHQRYPHQLSDLVKLGLLKSGDVEGLYFEVESEENGYLLATRPIQTDLESFGPQPTKPDSGDKRPQMTKKEKQPDAKNKRSSRR